MVPVLTHQLGRLVLELLALAALLGVGVPVARRLIGRPLPLPHVAAALLGAFALVAAVAHFTGDRVQLGDDRRLRLSERAGIDYCLKEDGAAHDIPFVEWVRRQMPKYAVYTSDQGAAEPDAWCLTLALEPALTVGPGHATPQYLITIGTTPPELKPLLARHDPAVRVFAPGYYLQRL
ncbi:MAG TPA: hypothetical protein VG223_01370 [Solirubrobacteraceae bacterium]|nr:hypothetical protein [Solirubrobacteraceae bacterium]